MEKIHGDLEKPQIWDYWRDKDVAAAVQYEREHLLAWWENQFRASIKGEAEEIELLLEEYDVPEEMEDCLRTVANQLKYSVTNGEFEDVIQDVQSDSFAGVLPDDKGDS